MNVFEHLVQEHGQAEQAMEQLREKPQKSGFEQLRMALEAHLGGEERVVYPAMDKYPELHMYVLESTEEHRIVRRLLGEITGLEPTAETWRAKFKVLKESIEHHIEEEEGTIFPEAQRLMDRTMIQDLDVEYSEVEKEIAA